MMFLIEAADRPISLFLDRVRDPTGSPVAMYSETIASRIRSDRFSRPSMELPVGRIDPVVT